MSFDLEDKPITCDGYQTVAQPGNVRRYKAPLSNNHSYKIAKRVVLSTEPEILEFSVYAPNVAALCEPGQFVIVRANENAERIPLTIADFDRKELTIVIVCQSIGRSSKIINVLQEGESFYDIAGPLGHASEIRENMGTIILVAGGVGTAPVYPIARKFFNTAGCKVITIFGARRKDLIFWEDKMRSVSHECLVTTDDGSYGIHGFGTTALQQLLDAAGYVKDGENANVQRRFDVCYAIGPLPMMRAVSDLTKPYKVPTIVSLNTIMVDGTGMCGACRVNVGGKTKFACVDGPEFDSHIVDWNNLRQRMGTYADAEQQEKLISCRRKPSFLEIAAKDAPPKQTQMPVLDPKLRAHNWSEVALGYNEQEARLEASRCLKCPKPRCVSGCPTDVPIPQFIERVKHGDFLGAYRIIKSAHSGPALSGRVCPQESQCQSPDGAYGCILENMKKEAVAIGRLERFVADYVSKNNLEEKALIDQETNKIIPVELTGKKVAIIGSGPAGLACATECAKAGHLVTIFEALHTPGGVLTYGIPEFRLPKSIVQQTIENIKLLGVVDIKTNYIIGKSAKISDLKAEGFSAFFIGTGAGLPRFLGIPGEDLPGILSANEFLTRCNLMKAYQFPAISDTPVFKAKQIVIIGAGNVAMDCARCATRLGMEASIVYRRRLQDCPARKEEVEHAQEEGVEFCTLHAPKEIVPDCEGKGIKGIRCQVNIFENGQIIQKPDNEEVFHTCQMIVIAVGQGPNPIVPSTTPGLQTERGLITTDEELKTSLDGVYAGGDVNTGAATVIKALGAGKKAGININKYLDAKTDCFIDINAAGKLFYPLVSEEMQQFYMSEADFEKRKK